MGKVVEAVVLADGPGALSFSFSLLRFSSYRPMTSFKSLPSPSNITFTLSFSIPFPAPAPGAKLTVVNPSPPPPALDSVKFRPSSPSTARFASSCVAYLIDATPICPPVTRSSSRSHEMIVPYFWKCCRIFGVGVNSENPKTRMFVGGGGPGVFESYCLFHQ